MIQYTSGTTDTPKGAVLHHRGLVNNGAHALDRMGVRDGSVWVTTMPMFHTGGCVICVLGAVSKRVTQVLVEAFDPALVLELIETYQCEAMTAVPTMLISMLEHPRFAATDLSSLRRLSSGGAIVPAALVTTFEERLGATFTILFGQTECSPVASMTCPTDTIADKAATIGPPMPHVEVHIVDPSPASRADRHRRRVLHPGLSRHAWVLRQSRRHGGGGRCRRLAAHRRPGGDGRIAATARSRDVSRR